MRTLLCTIALSLCFAGSAPARVQEGVELRWRGRPGDVLRLRLTMTQTMTNSMMPEPFETETSMVMRQEVMEVSEEGVGSLDVAYEAIRMKAGAPAALDYDSSRKGDAAKANDPTLAAMFEPLLAADVRMKITPSGEILEIAGLEHAFDGMEAAAPGMGEMFEKTFGGESLKRMVEVTVFPEKTLVAGDTWQRDVELEVPMLGTMAVHFDNVLEGKEKRGTAECARIGVRGTMELEMADPASPAKVTLDESTFSGTLFIELERGFLQESQIESTMSFTMSIPGGEGMTMEMEMQQRMVRIGTEDPLFE
jgi:hypothetical protein